MENLFNYATKEFVQDAVLCWLFANWDCEKKCVRTYAKQLIKKFCGITTEEFEIINLQIKKQEQKMDIVIRCTLKVDKKEQDYLIVIEDKTVSKEHNQLVKYNEKIDKILKSKKDKTRTPIKIFYKTSLVWDDKLLQERTQVEKVAKWKLFDIQKIYNVFNEINNMEDVEIESDILKDYVECINKLYNELCGKLPDKISEWNTNHWRNFGYKFFKNKTDWNWAIENRWTTKIFFKFPLHTNASCVEVRSNEFSEKKGIRGLLQVYNGVQLTTAEQRESMCAEIRKNKWFIEVRPNQKKEIANTGYITTVYDEKSLANFLNRCYKEFKKIKI